MYAKLEDHQRNSTNIEVTANEDSTLYSWVNRQRRQYFLGKLSKEKQTLLESIGLIWDVKGHAQEQDWQSMFRSSIALQAQTRLMGKQCPSCSPWTAKVHRFRFFWAAEPPSPSSLSHWDP